MRSTALLLCAAAAVLIAAGPEDEIRAAEKAWIGAVTKQDAATLEKTLAAQLIYAHSTGIIEDKAQYLARLKSGAQRYATIEQENLTIRVYGNSAVAHSKVRMTGKSDKRDFDDRLMMIHFWVKQGGSWQLVAHQTTRLQ